MSSHSAKYEFHVQHYEDIIEDIRAWMAADQSKRNDEIAEIILIGTQQQLDKVNISNLNIGQADSATCQIRRP